MSEWVTRLEIHFIFILNYYALIPITWSKQFVLKIYFLIILYKLCNFYNQNLGCLNKYHVILIFEQ